MKLEVKRWPESQEVMENDDWFFIQARGDILGLSAYARVIEETDDEVSEPRSKPYPVKSAWTCGVCGKPTTMNWQVSSKEVIHPRLHLKCAIEEEAKGVDIKEQYHEASSKLFKIGKRESVKYSSKGPEYDYRENPSIPYLPGKYTEEELKDKNEMSPLDWWKKENPQLELELNKLSEEIVDNKHGNYMYESSDGGKTIYRREYGSNKKELVEDWNEAKNEMIVDSRETSQVIKEVLDKHKDGQGNIGSEYFRKMLAEEIHSRLMNEYKSEEQLIKESWTCAICGKNTYDVEWDYLGSGTNHLGCELEIEMKTDKRGKK